MGKIMNNDQIIEGMANWNPFNPDKAINIYRYGSHVYGTVGTKSDFDIITVSDIEEPYVQFHYGDFNCTTFSIMEFERRLDDHEITMLECIFLPEKMIVRNEHNYSEIFKVDKYKLRHAVSKKASNSFVKAKKKFIIEVDRNIYVGKKSLFHSLRIPIFGRQLAQHGKVLDYSEANHYWPRIRDCKIEDWGYYKKTYQPILNDLMSKFRKVAPK
jgi:hypothetical protein